MNVSRGNRKKTAIPRNIILLGVVSLFTGAAMILLAVAVREPPKNNVP